MDDSENMVNQKNNNGVIAGAIIFGLILIGIILFFIFQGSTTTTGDNLEGTTNKALVCTSDILDYPFFAYDNSDHKYTEINILFSGNDMQSISLSHSLYYYNDNSLVVGSEAHNHAAMNMNFSESGLPADSFNAKYTKFENEMRMDLYTTESNINSRTLNYFLIDVNDGYVPSELGSYRDFYESKGMNCEEFDKK